MATAGPNYPSNVLDTDPGVNIYDAWGADRTNVGAADGTVASVSLDTNEEGTSYYMDCLAFGFSIPSAAINGITAEIHRRSTNAVTPRIQDSVVQLIKGGTPVGDNKAIAVDWTGTLATATYGGVSDLWGVGWSTAEVNAVDFGLRFQCFVSTGSSNRTAEVDFIRITITYTEGGGGGGGGPNRVVPFNGGSAGTSISVNSMIIPINMPAT